MSIADASRIFPRRDVTVLLLTEFEPQTMMCTREAMTGPLMAVPRGLSETLCRAIAWEKDFLEDLAASNLTPRICSSINEGLFSRLNETAYIVALKAGFKRALMAQALEKQRDLARITESGRELIRTLLEPRWIGDLFNRWEDMSESNGIHSEEVKSLEMS